MRGILRGVSALLAPAFLLTGCSGSPKSTQYVTSMRQVEKRVRASHLTDQQLVALGRTICRNLSAGESRKQQVELASSRLDSAVAGAAAYLLAIHVLCPRQAGQAFISRWRPTETAGGPGP